MIAESTTLSKMKDYETGTKRKGMQLSPLSSRIASYDGSVAIRPLILDRTPQDMQKARDLRRELKGRPYEKDKLELLRAAFSGPFANNEEDLSSLFCSEWYAELLQAWNCLTNAVPSNSYSPSDFAEGSSIQLKRGQWGEQYEVVT